MSWSFTSLVKKHGEEAALLMLQDQRGYGEFGKNFAAHVNGQPTEDEATGHDPYACDEANCVTCCELADQYAGAMA